jgi:hypothetical protein
VNFSMAYDIDIHQLNLAPFINLNKLDEIPFKIYIFFKFNNKCIVIIFKGKITTISKRRRFYKWALHWFFLFSFVW